MWKQGIELFGNCLQDRLEGIEDRYQNHQCFHVVDPNSMMLWQTCERGTEEEYFLRG